MKNLLFANWKKYIVLLGVFVMLFFPNYAYVQMVIDDTKTIDSINLEIIDKNLNARSIGNMEYNYPNIYFKKMSLNDLLWDARQYKIEINKVVNELTDVHDGKVNISDVSIYLGRWKIYELNADNLLSNDTVVSPENLQIIDESFVVSFNEWKGEIEITNIRRAIFVNVSLVFCAYFIMFFGFVALYDKFLSCIHIERIKAYIKNAFTGWTNYLKNIVFFIILVYLLRILLEIINVELNIRQCEIYLQGIAISIVYTFISSHTNDIKKSILATFIIGVFIIITSTNLTTFMGPDEYRAINEQLYLQEDIFRHWYMQNSHTNYLIMGTLLYLIPSQLIENISISGYEVAKWLHWLCGFLVIQTCVSVIFTKLKKQNTEDKYNIIILSGLYLSFFACPILIQSLYYYSYDMFSCTFAILALLLTYFGYKNTDLKWATIAVFVGTLSLQEKIVVIPLMFFISVAWIDIYVSEKKKNTIYYFVGSALAIGMQVLVCMFTEWWVVKVLKAGNVYVQDHRTLTNIVYLEQKLIGWKSYLLAFIILWVLMAVAGICLNILRKYIKKAGRGYNIIASVLIITYEITGICVNFIDRNSLDLETYSGYFLNHIRNCVNQYTTVFLVVTMLILLYNIKTNIIDNYEISVLGILSVLMAVLYTIMGEYSGPRYCNIYISGFMIIFSLIILEKIKFEKVKGLYILLMVVITVVEMLPNVNFCYWVYYPLWNVSIYQKDNILKEKAAGSLGHIYMDEILEYCENENIPFSDIRIYIAYQNNLTENIWNIPYNRMINVPLSEHVEIGLSENSFYCIDNYSINDDMVAIDSGYISTESAEPIIEITYRGVPVSKIYRGDQLKLIVNSD